MKRGMNRAQATALYDSGFRRFLAAEERACFQPEVDGLCMPFPVFHQAVEMSLNRHLGAGEYLRPRGRLDAPSGKLPVPSFEDILEQVPREALPLVVAG